jgi:hypothetical protein
MSALETMPANPVHFAVERSQEQDRVHVVIRLLVFLVLGSLGMPSHYGVVYLVLPLLAALLIAQKGSKSYLAEDAPRIVTALRWLAAGYAYLWLLTDRLPSKDRPGPIELEVHPSGEPTTTSALARLLFGLPAMVVLVVMSLVACLMWAIGAIAILFATRVPSFVADFMAATLRYQFRLAAYLLSLVDAYPSFEEAGVSQVPSSGVV